MDLIRKYEAYRNILKTGFLVVGGKPGYSLPADARNASSMHFGDAAVFLGWYMGILATEYHLLSNGLISSGTLHPRKTLRELFFALKALDRLIGTAPGYFNPPAQSPPVVPRGFFIRDDVPQTIKLHFQGVTGIISDYQAAVKTQNEESQDQLIHLLLGLSLVHRFLPVGAAVLGKNLMTLSQRLAYEICAWPSRTRWVIRNPYLDLKKVDRGPYAVLFSHPIVKILERVDGRASELKPTVCLLFKLLWKYVLKHNLGRASNATNLHLILTLASLSDSWSRNSLRSIIRLSRKFDWPVYPLLNVVMWGDVRPWKKPWIPALREWAGPMLRSAPEGGLSHDGSPPGWKASHRFLFGREAQDEGQSYYAGMSFPGVDFMLLHNLFQIANNLGG